MKINVLILVIISFFGISMAKNNDDNIEPCGESFFLTNGSKWIYNNYDKKDRLISVETVFLDTVLFFEDRTEFILDNKTEYVNAETTEASQAYQNTPKVKYICKEGKVFQDISFIYGMGEEEQTQDTVLNINNENGNLYYPTEFVQGSTLPEVHYSVILNDKKIAEYHATNRKVSKIETIDINKYSFDCALVDYDVHSKMYGINFYQTIKEWYSPEIGIVKTEIYNKKGKLKSKKVLVDFER